MRKHKESAMIDFMAVTKLTIKMAAVTTLSIVLMACQPKANFSVKAAHYLNPDIDGRASPVLITVYQLKNGYTFEQADYDALMSNSASLLGSDLIDKNSFEIRPATHISVSENLYPDTRYIGVVAAYRSADIANWHRVIKLKNPGHSLSMDLSLEAQGLSVKVR